MSDSPTLDKLIAVSPRFVRSVSLARDAYRQFFPARRVGPRALAFELRGECDHGGCRREAMGAETIARLACADPREIVGRIAERDAAIAAMIELAASAVITTRAPVLTAIGDVELAAAVAAPQ